MILSNSNSMNIWVYSWPYYSSFLRTTQRGLENKLGFWGSSARSIVSLKLGYRCMGIVSLFESANMQEEIQIGLQ